jgi:hypothetical protein
VVFDRPGSGPAGFVAAGSAGAPLPRVNVTARDTPASLSVRLRTGVPAPLPANAGSFRDAGTRAVVGDVLGHGSRPLAEAADVRPVAEPGKCLLQYSQADYPDFRRAYSQADYLEFRRAARPSSFNRLNL